MIAVRRNAANAKGKSMLTKYVVGAKAKPPKNPSSPPKKGNVMATNMVNAACRMELYIYIYMKY